MRNTLVNIAPALVDPFARTPRRPSRMHPRRDDEGHPQNGGDGGNDSEEVNDENDPDDAGADKPDDDGDKEIDWKKESRKHEREAKAGRAAIAELEKIKAKNRTSEETAQKERDDARAEAEAAKAEAAIERAARKHGLTDDRDLKILEGLPADKIDAVAKAIAAGKNSGGPGKGTKEVGGDKGDKKKPTTLGGAIAAHYSK